MNLATGQSNGPEASHGPGEVCTPAALVGHLPSVQATIHTGRMAKVDDAVGRLCIFIVFIMWVVIPLAAGLGLILGR